MTDLVKLFVACSSWRILQHRLNRIFDCYLTRIFELCQDIVLNTNIYMKGTLMQICKSANIFIFI